MDFYLFELTTHISFGLLWLCLIFYFFISLVLILPNSFFALFSLIIVYIINVIFFFLFSCYFQGFLILLLYVGALTVLFLFLIMLLDYRVYFKLNINFLYFIFIFLFSCLLSIFFFTQNYYFEVEVPVLNDRTAIVETFIRYVIVQIFKDMGLGLSVKQPNNNDLEDYTYFLENYSQIERLGLFMYSNFECILLIILIGFFSFVILVSIFSLLRKK